MTCLLTPVMLIFKMLLNKQSIIFPLGFNYLPYVAAFFVALLFVLIRIFYLPQFLDFDQIWYSENIRKSLGPDGVPVSIPHHLHFAWLGKSFQQFITDIFPDLIWQDLIFVNRLRAIIFSAVAVFFLFLFIFDISGKYFWSFLGCCLIVLSYGFFHYSALVDTGIYPVLGTIMTLWLFNRLINAQKINFFMAFFCGIVLFLNIMFHQYLGVINVFFIVLFYFKVPVVQLNFLKSFQYNSKMNINSLKNFSLNNHMNRFMMSVFMLIVAFGLIILAYIYVGKTVYQLPFEGEVINKESDNQTFSYLSFQKWLFLYENYSNWGNGIKVYNPKKVFTGFTNAFLAPPFLTTRRLRGTDLHYNFKNFFKRENLVYNVFAILTLFVFIMLVLSFPDLYKRFGSSFLFILLSFICFSILFTYWEPDYFEFWLVPIVLFCLLFLMIMILLCEKISYFIKTFSEIVFSVLIFSLILFFTLHNWTEYVIPYSSVKQLEEIDPEWNLDYCKRLFSSGIYKYPDQPYSELYNNDYYPKKEIYLPQWANGSGRF